VQYITSCPQLTNQSCILLLPLQVAAAKAEAQLQRAELVEKAKEAGEQQQVTKAAGSFMDLLGLSDKDLGLAK
jgi:hypothetical protein